MPGGLFILEEIFGELMKEFLCTAVGVRTELSETRCREYQEKIKAVDLEQASSTWQQMLKEGPIQDRFLITECKVCDLEAMMDLFAGQGIKTKPIFDLKGKIK